MPSTRQINQAGLDIIKHYEGWRDRQYICPAGKPTIGWGHVIRPGEALQGPISEAQGLALLVKDVEEAADAVERLVKVPLNDNQFSALVSLTYNIGADEDHDGIAEGLGDSTLLRLLNQGDYQGAADEFPKWRKSRRKVLEGLVERRADEQALFFTPCEQPKAEAAPMGDVAQSPFQKETIMDTLAMKLLLPLLMKMLPQLISSVTPALKGVIWNGVQAFKTHAYETPNPVDNVVADAFEGLVTGLGLAPTDPQPAS